MCKGQISSDDCESTPRRPFLVTQSGSDRVGASGSPINAASRDCMCKQGNVVRQLSTESACSLCHVWSVLAVSLRQHVVAVPSVEGPLIAQFLFQLTTS